METTLIVGCGYLGRHVAATLQQTERPILALTAHCDSATALQARGYTAYPVDLDKPCTAPLPDQPYRVLYLVPPNPTQDTDLRLQNYLDALTQHLPTRFVYASSSAVYGDRKGAWVDEDTPVSAQSATAARRIDAENRLRTWSAEHGVSHVVLRIAGIYGPGRLPLARLRNARPVVREEEAGWSNRIHIDDLTRICIAALDHPSPRALYNVADGTPTSSTAFLQAVARHCGICPLPLVSRAEALRVATPGQARFLRESRRLDTTRLRQDLAPHLIHPNINKALQPVS